MENVTITCPCPGTPHPDGDSVGLLPKLGLRGGVRVQSAIVAARQDSAKRNEPVDAGDMTGLLSELYVLEGVKEWTLLGSDGKPIPVTPDNIREHLLSDFSLASPVADKADELYMSAVVLPLLAVPSTSSPTSRTNGSTSAQKPPTAKRPRQSKRSSTSTSQMGATATTSG